MIWWLSWFDEDERPLKVDPVQENILGYWCTGYTLDDPPKKAVVAAIQARTLQTAWAIVEREWDGPKNLRRFGSELERRPGDRFPIPEWAEGRWPKDFPAR